MRVVVLGHSFLGLRVLECLRDLGVDIVGVLSHREAPGEFATDPSVEGWARQAGIAVTLVPPYRRLDCAARIAGLRPDVAISAGFRTPLARATLEVPRLGVFNLHPSLLPRYRGRSPVNWAVLSGETEHGVTLHHMVEEIDAGDIVDQRRVPIGPDDTALDVIRRLEREIPGLVTTALPLIATGKAPRIPQDPTAASSFGGRRPEDGRLHWHWPAKRIHDLVRAVTHPFPGAFTHHDGQVLFLWRTGLLAASGRRPGTGFEAGAGRFAVAAGDGAVEVLRFSVGRGPERDGDALAGIWDGGEKA